MFLNPLFLIGAASASVPVLIHLMHRRRTTTIDWPSLKFLVASHRRTSRRRRIEEVLLLILRSGLLVLISLALARPVLRAGGFLGEQAEVAIAIVLDNSMSMSAKASHASTESTRFALAKAAAQEIIRQAPPRSRLALRLADGTEPPMARVLSPNRELVEAALRSAQQSDARGDLSAQLVHAFEDLSSSGAASLELYCLTDLAASAFVNPIRSRAAEKRINVIFVDCGKLPVHGVAITSVAVRARRPVARVPFTVDIRLKNFAPVELERNVFVEVSEGGRYLPLSERLVRLGPTGTVSFGFQLALERAGEHVGRVRISPGDELAADDIRHFRIHLADRVPVLVVERSGGEGGGALRGSRAVALALAPGAASPFEPKLLSSSELAGMTADGLFKMSPVAILVELAEIPEWEAKLWAEFVRAGGTVIAFPSETSELAPASETLARASGGVFLPAQVGRRLGDAISRTKPMHIDTERADFRNEDLLSVFRDLEPTLRAVSVWQAYDLRTDGIPGARTVLSLEGGGAFLAARRSSGGEVYLFAVPVGTAWSDLPARALFLPLIHSIVHRAASPRDEERSFLAGSSPRIGLPLAWASKTVLLTDPQGKAVGLAAPLVAEGRLELALPPLTAAGAWRLAVAGEPAMEGQVTIVVNTDPEESDPTRVGLSYLRELCAGTAVEPLLISPEGLPATIAKLRKGIELWDAMFAVALGVALFECFFSNRLAAGSGRQTSEKPARVGT